MPTRELPEKFYTAAQVRELDRVAIEELGIDGDLLMERAGRAAFRVMRQRWPDIRRLAVFCGSGNNGGDGYVVARMAAEAGLRVALYQKKTAAELSGSAKVMAERALETEGIDAFALDQPPESLHADLIVDGLLGTGLSGELRDDYKALVQAINASGIPVFALDIPSGLSGDSGRMLGGAVRAEATATFIGLKAGLLTGAGPGCCGELWFDDLQVPDSVYQRVAAAGERLTPAIVTRLLPPRARDAHKGDFGHVLIVGGDRGFGGAAIMAAQAAGRAGAGLVSAATRPEHVTAFLARQPEIMVRGVEQQDELDALLERATVVVLGPGLGQGEWGRALLARVLKSGKPRVLDADALNLIAAEPPQPFREQVLTPHPGEAARLLGNTTADIQRARFAAVQDIQRRYGGAAVLKGAGSLVCAGPDEPLGLCSDGNPGMASGGMGDVLSGLLGGLMAQGLPPGEAARVGVLVHALAADRSAAQSGERGLLATDLLDHIRPLLNGLPA